MAHSLPIPVPVPAQLQLHSDGLQSVTAAGSLIGLQPGEPRGSLIALLHPRKSHGCALFPFHQQVHVPAGALTDRPALSPAWVGVFHPGQPWDQGLCLGYILAAPVHAAKHALDPKTRLSLGAQHPAGELSSATAAPPAHVAVLCWLGSHEGHEPHRYPEQNSGKTRERRLRVGSVLAQRIAELKITLRVIYL